MKCSNCKKQIDKNKSYPLVGDVGIHYFCNRNCFDKWEVNLRKNEEIKEEIKLGQLTLNL